MVEHKHMYSVSEVLERRISSLGLRDFPTGVGSWRPKTTSTVARETIDESYVLDLKSAQNETVDSLLDFIKDKSSPFRQDNSWSSQVAELREMCIRDPSRSKDSLFLVANLHHLDLSNSRINQVNQGCLLKFTNLEDLALCSNFIEKISSLDLPQNLKSLDMSSNRMRSIGALTDRRLDALKHLAVNHNELDEKSYTFLKATNWPSLVSLDLSFNHLSDLLTLIAILKQSKTLRILQLRGNPLTLVPGYRGFVVDSLKSLTVLDDIQVTPDEKYVFKNFTNRKETNIDGAKLRFELRWIRSLPIPEELLNPEQPDYPVIVRKYFVQFHFISDDSADSSPVIKSDARDFSEEHIVVDWHQVVTRKKLRALRDFLMSPMKLDLVEEKTLLYPKDSEEVTKERTGSTLRTTPQPEKDKKGKQEEKAAAAKPAGKKGKREEVELVAVTSECTTVCSWNMDMVELLSDSPFVEYAFTKGVAEASPPSAFAEIIQQELEQRENGGKKKDKKKPPPPPPQPVEPKKDGKGKKGDDEPERQEDPVPQPQVCVAIRLLRLTNSTQVLQE